MKICLPRHFYLFAIGLIFASMHAYAEPFVVSDPWPKGDKQPTHCRYRLNGGSEVDAEVEKLFDGSVRCMMDVTNATPGKNTLVVVAVNRNVSPEDLSAPVNMDFDSSELSREAKGLDGSPVALVVALVVAIAAAGISWWWAKKKRSSQA